MIQRIQSIFILFSVFFSLIAVGFFYLTFGEFLVFTIDFKLIIVSVLLTSGLLSMVSLLLFKNRKNQIVLNNLVVLLNVTLVALFLYQLLNLSGESIVSEKGILVLFFLIVIFSSVFANRYIKKDQRLVKSVDRIR